MRFEPDDGKTFGFEWGKVCVGTADYAQRHEKASRSRKKVYPEMTEEEKHWVTFYARTGEVYSFRDEKDATP